MRPGVRLAGYRLDVAPGFLVQAEGRTDPVEVGRARHGGHEFEHLGAVARGEHHGQVRAAVGDTGEEDSDEAGRAEDEPRRAVAYRAQPHARDGDVDHSHADGRARGDPGEFGGFGGQRARLAGWMADVGEEPEETVEAEVRGEVFVVSGAVADVKEGA